MALGFIGSFAALYYEPRQDRKVATVVAAACAEDVLMKPLKLKKLSKKRLQKQKKSL